MLSFDLFHVKFKRHAQKSAQIFFAMPGDAGKVQFPLPAKYLEHPGEAPSFQLWNIQFENYMFSVDSQRALADKMMDEFKNRLLFSLLGNEAVSSFACIL